jgi:type IV pilus assembly protein PilC
VPEFSYIAREPDGRIARGSAEASHPGELLLRLRERGMQLLKVEQASSRSAWRSQLAALHPLNRIPPTGGQVEMFLDQMTVLLNSGMSLLASLRTTEQQSLFEPMRRIIADLSLRIQAGSSLADAMERHPCFPPLVVQMVRVGEKTGNLDLVFSKSSQQIAQRRAHRNNVVTALAYPLFVALAAIGAASFMVGFVIPKLKTFLSGLGRQLPAMTQRLVDISDWFQRYGAHLVFGLVILTFGIFVLYMTPRGRMAIDRLLLRIPVVGKIFRVSGTYSFSSAMAVLIRSDVTVLESLKTVEALHGNKQQSNDVRAMRLAVLEGSDLSTAMKRSTAFAPILPSMIAIAENTGRLDDVLQQVADYHETQLQKMIKRLSSLIEPAIIILVGGIVGYVYIAFFIAIYSIGGSYR